MARRWQIMVLGPLVAGVFALPAAAQQPQPPGGIAPGQQLGPGGQQEQPATPQPRITPGERGFVPPPSRPSEEPGPSLGSPPALPEMGAGAPSGRGSGPTTPSSSVPLTPGASGGLGGQASGGMGGMGAGPTGGGAPGAGGGGR
jgi:translation initiation factor IF-2